MSKDIVIYHGDCADGFGAAYAAYKRLGDSAYYVPMDHKKDGNTIDDVLAAIPPEGLPLARDMRIYVLDFGFPAAVFDALGAACNGVTQIDHHKSSFEECSLKMGRAYNLDLGDGDRLILDEKHSGAWLAWRFFHPLVPIPLFIDYLDDYDRWQFQLTHSKAFQRGLWSYAPWDLKRWDMFLNEEAVKHVVEEGQAILRAHDQQVTATLERNVRQCVIPVGIAFSPNTYVCGGIVNAPRHMVSDLGHQLAAASSGFGIVWELGNDGVTAHCSIRGTGNFDCEKLAKEFGGGGHHNSAGFKVPVRQLLEWL